MALRFQTRRKRATAALLTLVTLLTVAPTALAEKFGGRWSISITIPDAPKSNSKRTFTVNVEVSPRGESLHGRVAITDEDNRTVSGAWRIVNKKVYITYEPPCPPDAGAPCATIILLGKLKNSNTKFKGDVIVMWDTENQQNPALFDTSNGSFSGDRLQ
ncbi:MAG TPA: hypothetical protein VJZ26_07695 [Blastocatellia bacterium]|nr:hypothetical protein [Blastocatellia bacterium]